VVVNCKNDKQVGLFSDWEFELPCPPSLDHNVHSALSKVPIYNEQSASCGGFLSTSPFIGD
jgi:hypothetical protein